jgi:hypothetical protein
VEGQYVEEEPSIVHPTNSAFWEWEDLPLAVALTQASKHASHTRRG